jgi:hypothetical protein
MAQAGGVMQKRKALAEHPFGTIKCRAGYRHFLVRGFEKVRGEWSLMALCYNFTRVLAIIGLARFIAYLAESRSILALWLFAFVAAATTKPINSNLSKARKNRSTQIRISPCILSGLT